MASPHRVLIVEEDRVEAGLLAFHLRQAGWTPLVVATAKEAQDAMGWGTPRALLASVDGGGLALAAALEGVETALFLTTDRALAAAEELEALRLGAQAILRKPLDFDSVAAQLIGSTPAPLGPRLSGLPDGAVSGRLEAHPLEYLLRMAHRHRLDARLHIALPKDDWAVIILRAGEVLDAEGPQETADAVLDAALRLAEGHFVVYPLSPDDPELGRPKTVSGDLVAVLARARGGVTAVAPTLPRIAPVAAADHLHGTPDGQGRDPLSRPVRPSERSGDGPVSRTVRAQAGVPMPATGPGRPAESTGPETRFEPGPPRAWLREQGFPTQGPGVQGPPGAQGPRTTPPPMPPAAPSDAWDTGAADPATPGGGYGAKAGPAPRAERMPEETTRAGLQAAADPAGDAEDAFPDPYAGLEDGLGMDGWPEPEAPRQLAVREESPDDGRPGTRPGTQAAGAPGGGQLRTSAGGRAAGAARPDGGPDKTAASRWTARRHAGPEASHADWSLEARQEAAAEVVPWDEAVADLGWSGHGGPPNTPMPEGWKLDSDDVALARARAAGGADGDAAEATTRDGAARPEVEFGPGAADEEAAGRAPLGAQARPEGGTRRWLMVMVGVLTIAVLTLSGLVAWRLFGGSATPPDAALSAFGEAPQAPGPDGATPEGPEAPAPKAEAAPGAQAQDQPAGGAETPREGALGAPNGRPDGPPQGGQESAAGLLRAGNAALGERRFDEAEARFQDVLESRPGDPEARYGLGLAWVGQGRFEDALGAFEGLATARPGDPTVQLALGGLRQRTGDRAGAAEALRRFLALAPEDPAAPTVRARLQALTAPEGAP